MDVNPYPVELTGYSHEEFLDKHLWEIGPFKDTSASEAVFARLQTEEYVRYEDLPLKTRDGRKIAVEFVSNVYPVENCKVIQCNIRDISVRQRVHNRETLAREVLESLNHWEAVADPVRDILYVVLKHYDIEAAGIRLRQGEDFPYVVTRGFTEEFLSTETTLCARAPDGTVLRDEKGKAELECMCGNVLCGRTDPKLPLFTDGGSFWSNSTTELLAGTTEANRQGRTRNRCNRDGFESVALIPLRCGAEIIGLLQLNDRRRDRFDKERIEFLEGLGASIGVALARQQAETALVAHSRSPSPIQAREQRTEKAL